MTDVTTALLPALKPLAALADGAFSELVALSAGVAAGTKGPEDLAAAPALRGLAGLPPVHEALVAVYLDCARLGTAGDDLAKALAPALPAGRAKAVAALLDEGRRALVAALEDGGFGPPEVVDVAWQRSSVVASRQRADARSLYVVTLTTRQPGGELTPLKFSATTEQLSSLVAELKQAVRQVEVLCE